MNKNDFFYRLIVAFIIVTVFAATVGIGIAVLIGVYKLILWLLAL